MKILILIFSFCIYIMANTIAQSYPEKPMLRINPDMHTNIITDMDVSHDEKYVLTCSFDKLAKLWNAENGQLIRTYRPPSNTIKGGQLRACTFSPDDQLVVTGGFSLINDHQVYFFNTHTGLMEFVIPDLGLPVVVLEYSDNGQYLAIGLEQDNIYIYEMPSLILKEVIYEQYQRVRSIDFPNKGGMVTVGEDGMLRIYDEHFQKKNSRLLTGGNYPHSISCSEDDNFYLVGYDFDTTTIELISSESLEVTETTSLPYKYDGYNSAVAEFSKDGNQIVVGGSYFINIDGVEWNQIRIYDSKLANYKEYNASKNSIYNIKALSDGRIVYSSSHPDWGIIDSKVDSQLVYVDSEINDYLDSLPHLKVSENGFEIGAHPKYQAPFTFDISKRIIEERESEAPSFTDNYNGYKVSGCEIKQQLLLNGKPLPLYANESCQGIDISDDGEWIVYTTEKGISLFNTKKDSMYWSYGSPTQPIEVNISGNRKVFVARFINGSIRWFDLRTCKQLLSLYVHPDRKRWILRSSSGYYDASPGAENLLGWQVNQGADKATIFYPISKFRDTYYRPDIISKILETTDEKEAIRLANQISSREVGESVAEIIEKQPPYIKIISPYTSSKIDSNIVEIEYSIPADKMSESVKVKVQINGRPVTADRGLKKANERGKISVKIPSRDCIVSLYTENDNDVSEPASIHLIWDGNKLDIDKSITSNLYVLAIGISDYDDNSINLNYADDDAIAFVETVLNQEGSQYSNIITRPLIDKDATKNKHIGRD